MQWETTGIFQTEEGHHPHISDGKKYVFDTNHRAKSIVNVLNPQYVRNPLKARLWGSIAWHPFPHSAASETEADLYLVVTTVTEVVNTVLSVPGQEGGSLQSAWTSCPSNKLLFLSQWLSSTRLPPAELTGKCKDDVGFFFVVAKLNFLSFSLLDTCILNTVEWLLARKSKVTQKVTCPHYLEIAVILANIE